MRKKRGKVQTNNVESQPQDIIAEPKTDGDHLRTALYEIFEFIETALSVMEMRKFTYVYKFVDV